MGIPSFEADTDVYPEWTPVSGNISVSVYFYILSGFLHYNVCLTKCFSIEIGN